MNTRFISYIDITCTDEKWKLYSLSSVGSRACCCVAPGGSAWVVGEAGVQESTRGGGVHAVLRPPQGCQERAAETKDRGPLSGEVQRAQQGHGSQTDAAAVKS